MILLLEHLYGIAILTVAHVVYRFGGEEYDHVRRETHGQVIGPVGSH
jgi:hypothetical protein